MSYQLVNFDEKEKLAGGFENRITTKLITEHIPQEFENLPLNQIEANSRIIANLYHVFNNYSSANVIIKSPNTDIFILAIAKLQSNIQVWFQTGTITLKQDLRRFIYTN